jgi:hypothetical protein
LGLASALDEPVQLFVALDAAPDGLEQLFAVLDAALPAVRA